MRRGLDPTVWGLIRQAGDMAAEMGYQLYAAGGVVRDLLVGYENLDVDLVVEGDGIALAERMAARMGAKLRVHPKFKTAELIFDNDFKIDVATARVEYYEYPAALPQVESSSLRQDLYRRDFTINAMAVVLNEDRFGDLVDYFGGREDLQYGLVRVLYNLSFIEDPTRILRAVRFEQRYHIKIEPQTLKLLKEAVKQNVLARVSRERIWDELYHLMIEPEAGKMLSRLNTLGVWPQVFPGVTYWEVQPVLNGLHRSIKMLKQWGFPEPGEKWLPYMIAVLHWSDPEVAGEICNRYSLSKRQAEKILNTLTNWREALAKVWRSQNQHRISWMAKNIMLMPRESYPLMLTILDEEWMRVRLRQILTAIRDNKPLVRGKFLKDMGFKPGPLYRDALDALWRERLDGSISTEEEEKEFLINFFITKGEQQSV
jgi:tRNA nucleotidyltransferase (CCA-adding enzyme)